MNSIENTTTKKHWNYRHFIYAIIILGYFLPIIIYCSYGTISSRSWSFFTLGLLISILGSGVLIFFMRNWEEGMRRHVSRLVCRKVNKLREGGFIPPRDIIREEEGSLRGEYEKQAEHYGQEITYLKRELQNAQESSEVLAQKMESSSQELSKLQGERQHLISQCKKFASRFQSIKDQYLSKVGRQEGVVAEHERQIAHQQGLIEQYQREIQQFKSRNEDLNYELKTVLELKDLEEEAESGVEEYYSYDEVPDEDVVLESGKVESIWQPAVIDSESAQTELQRCIGIAEDISEGSRLGNGGSGVITMFMDSYAIDMRRLFEQYRNVDDNVIFFYSPQEDRLVFINRQVRDLVGFTPERFINDFYRLVQNVDDWKVGLQQLEYNQITTIRLLVKDKSGGGLWVDCHLGRIPVGIFSNNVVGVLCSAA